jgi:glucose-6-phosphate 1-dehydrogenase
MRDLHSEALVFFGATGDLAYKKIFPSLQAMVKRGTLKCAGYRRREGWLEHRPAANASEGKP